MRRTVIYLIAIVLSLTLAGCRADCITIASLENCNSAGAAMSYHKFDGVKEYKLDIGDCAQNIQVDIETKSGCLNAYIVTVGGKKADAVYKGNDLASASFRVKISEPGAYLVHLEAVDHRGSYSFQVLDARND